MLIHTIINMHKTITALGFLFINLWCANALRAAEVTFRLNMNGISGFTTPEVNGTFNNWCGSCNSMNDANGDGIWEATIDLPAGMIEYKFSFDNWAGQENLSAASGCVVGNNEFTNRFLIVQHDIVLDVACWGLCSACLPADTSNWVLTWSDEFNGNALNEETWTPEFGSSGWGNNEWQNYTNNPDNLEVSNGRLRISAIKQGEGLGGYTSARIITNNKMEFKYGKIEARIKVPSGQGIWPAFWMLGANFEEVGWPRCGEIDIMEHVNNEPLTNSAIHWFNNGGHTYRSSSVPVNQNSFQMYGAIWNENGVTFLINDYPYYYFQFQEGNNTAQIFQKPFFLLLNVAVGGNWPGYPDATTPFPAIMEVDYIRIYSQEIITADTKVKQETANIYPVPFTDYVNLMLPANEGSFQVSVKNLLGEEIEYLDKQTGLLKLNTKAWNKGIYIIKIQSQGSEPLFRKVLKN